MVKKKGESHTISSLDAQIDTSELDQIMEILESMEDEKLAVTLLKKFNDASAKVGMLLRNRDPGMENSDWKKSCDKAQKELDQIVAEIFSFDK